VRNYRFAFGLIAKSNELLNLEI